MFTRVVLSLFLGFMLFSFFSCSTAIAPEYDSESTLRAEAVEISRRLRWTEELEPTRLTEKISSSDGFDKKLQSSPQNVYASGAENLYPALYPSLEGFSALDTGAMPPELRNKLSEFFDSLKQGKVSAASIKKTNLYTLAFFLSDIEAFVGKENTLQNYVLGDAFLNENFALCPIRLYYKEITVDISVALAFDSGTWQILQLDFL